MKLKAKSVTPKYIPLIFGPAQVSIYSGNDGSESLLWNDQELTGDIWDVGGTYVLWSLIKMLINAYFKYVYYLAYTVWMYIILLGEFCISKKL